MRGQVVVGKFVAHCRGALQPAAKIARKLGRQVSDESTKRVPCARFEDALRMEVVAGVHSDQHEPDRMLKALRGQHGGAVTDEHPA